MVGELDEARALLIEAKSQLPLVAEELKKARHPEPESVISLPDWTITHGGADQAYEYRARYGKYWLASEDAMALIASI
uniref:Uncharacterized protein n=1 Tax=Candidatus Kentrum sp. LFY TaxID=2126342 RepID=A0A450UG87_9GAMM|nr:MAG: hypothetical protein BECKLFY1418B_GA0070995_102610 [Candidatus Kentron sp. LFY]